MLCTVTVSVPNARFISLANVTVLRRYGSAPGVEPVVCVLARFSAITRSRVPCTPMPAAEIASAFSRSKGRLRPAIGLRRPSQREPEERRVFAVEIERQRLRGLGVGDLAEFLVHRDGVAVRLARVRQRV